MISTTNRVIKNIIILLQILNITFAVDYMIITTSSLKESALKISDIYSNSTAPYYLDVEIALVDTMANSINNFLNNKINNDLDLKYLLIIGDEIDIPSPTKSVSCGDGQDEYPSDDFYTSLNQSNPPRLATGRIPTSDLDKAVLYTEKLKKYIEQPSVGSWKNKILLISDDEIKSNTSIQSEIQHTIYSDSIYQSISSATFTKTLYGPMYEAEYNGSDRRLPGLTQDIITYLNDGAALINYIGHGDPETWSAEHIIDKDRDINLIDIPDTKLPIWIAGTCYFGRYDNVESMSEALLLETNGAISIVGATRSISKAINKKFLENFYNDLITHIEDGEGILRLGDLFINSKNHLFNAHQSNFHYTSNCDGGYLYDILGDPAIPLPFPNLNNNILSFNENISLLNTYSIEPNNDLNEYQFLQILDEDVTIDLNYEQNGEFANYTFSYSPSIIYENEFLGSTCYIPPLDLVSNEYIKFKFYTETDEIKETTYSDEIAIVSSEMQTDNDNYGPTIDFTQNNLYMTSNSVVSQGGTINVILSDPLGINTSESIGHSSKYWFNDELSYNQINSEDCDFIESCNDIICNIKIPADLINENILYVESWDNANNMAIDSLSINIITDSNQFLIFNVLNFPNPFSDRTFFTYQIDNESNTIVDSIVNIYSQSGELIVTLDNSSSGNFIAIEWDGTDASSNLLPNGTYIYAIDVIYGDKNESKIGAISLIR